MVSLIFSAFLLQGFRALSATKHKSIRASSHSCICSTRDGVLSAGSDIGKKSKIGVNKKKSPPEGSSFVTEDFRVQSGSALLKPAAVLSRALWGNLWSFGRYRRLHVRDVIGMLSCCECAWLGYTTLSGLRAATWFAGELLPLPFLAGENIQVAVVLLSRDAGRPAKLISDRTGVEGDGGWKNWLQARRLLGTIIVIEYNSLKKEIWKFNIIWEFIVFHFF